MREINMYMNEDINDTCSDDECGSTFMTRAFNEVDKGKIGWRKISAENLDMDYACNFLPHRCANLLLQELEASTKYFTGDFAKVRIFGKWHSIPRQQVAYGDPGLSYKFSGNTIPALTWPPILKELRDLLQKVTGTQFNFALVNRYRDGRDHIGEHRDNEAELDPAAAIASVSLGQTRDFVLRHSSARLALGDRKHLPVARIKVPLAHGSLLLMNPPTNVHWYHSLPPRKSCPGIRINLTFRKMTHAGEV